MAWMQQQGTIQIQLDQEKLREVQRLLDGIRKGGRDGASVALSRAVNKALKSANTVMAEEVRKELVLLKKTVTKNFVVKLTSPGLLVGSFRSTGRPVPLIEYGARQTREGVTIQIKQSKGRKLIKNAFIAQMKSGHKGVFSRVHNLGTGRSIGTPGAGTLYSFPKRWPKAYRLPITELFGPRVEDVAGDPPAMEAVMAKGNDVMVKELDRQVELLLRQQQEMDAAT